jgi:coenzyme F420-reducing hydrogenase beta subunit
VEEIFQRGAVGGTTTGLVYYLMKKGFIVAAALTKRRHPDRLFCMHPVPYIATTLEEVMEGAHSKREASPVLTQLKELSKYSKVAIVGVPCHIQAIRKLQVICQDEVLSRKLSTLASVAEKLTKNIQYAISINCFMNFKVGAIDAILKHYNAKEEDLIKFHEDTDKRLYSLIEKEGKNFTWFTGHNFMTKSGREVVEDLVEITPLATFGGCFLCPDFVVSRFADASIGVTAGCVKALEFGYNSVIVRNPELKKVFDDMVQNGEYRRRPILEGHGKNIRVSIERIIPTLDVLGAAEYFKTGNWHIHDWMKQSEQHAYGTGIIGLERLFFAQKIKKKLFFDGPLKEFKKIEAFTPVFY